jgi:hypothetical protein
MRRDSNPRYAFDVNTLSREIKKGNDVRSGFPSTDRAICRDRRLPASDSNGQQNGQQKQLSGHAARRRLKEVLSNLLLAFRMRGDELPSPDHAAIGKDEPVGEVPRPIVHEVIGLESQQKIGANRRPMRVAALPLH